MNEFKRICKCGRELNYTSKKTLDTAIKNNKGCYSCANKYMVGNVHHSGGYIRTRNYDPKYLEMAGADGYIFCHRLVYAEHIGRLLKQEERIHHIDHDKRNNDISNLMLFANDAGHMKHHRELDRLEKLLNEQLKCAAQIAMFNNPMRVSDVFTILKLEGTK